MLIRGLVVVAAVLTLGQGAIAGEKPTALRRVSCTGRFYVARYSEVAAETWARNHGATDAEIESARKCFVGSNVQTGSLR
jgi:hypothetical protein